MDAFLMFLPLIIFVIIVMSYTGYHTYKLIKMDLDFSDITEISEDDLKQFKGLQLSWLEHPTHNRQVVGSSPTRPTKLGEAMSKYTVKIEQDPDTGDLILPIPDELLAEIGWNEGDELIWEETMMCEDDGEYPGYSLRKKDAERL